MREDRYFMRKEVKTQLLNLLLHFYIVLKMYSLADTFKEVTVLSSEFSATHVKVTFSSGAILILLENLPLIYLVSSVWKKRNII